MARINGLLNDRENIFGMNLDLALFQDGHSMKASPTTLEIDREVLKDFTVGVTVHG